MIHKEACDILKIKEVFTQNELKTAYKKLALIYHPDKYKQDDGEKFKSINEAYVFLSENPRKTEESLLINFIKYMNIPVTNSPEIIKLINILNNFGIKYAIEHIQTYDEDIQNYICNFLIKYKSFFNFSDDIIKQLDDIIQKQRCIYIYPTLKDLLSCSIEKKIIDNMSYSIPVWHNELYYGDNIVIKCVPQLPKHMYIDEDNNLHININYKTNLKYLLSNTYITYTFEDMKLDIDIKKLYIQQNQDVIFSCVGIPQINTYNYFDIKKGNIIVHLELIYDD